MPKGFNLQCPAGKTARVGLQGKGGGLKPGEAAVLLPPKEGETDESPVTHRAPLPADRHGAKTGVFLSEVRDYRPLRDCVENEKTA